ncbi:hypothetical protein M0638_01945 [Roseomonas sp. NAR14]|uniref:Uncharacterized protein n=1 Tax=Roseomonas acroporae TaxID=2937791 RepID=A0A9X1Y401_9PROT|nr:hypothetical protein [Roseomonas acroporae]MCK8783141.1 hypothetical protein [Roseomonas acroporae]
MATASAGRRSPRQRPRGTRYMRGILLWLIGIPIPVIILLWLFGVLH